LPILAISAAVSLIIGTVFTGRINMDPGRDGDDPPAARPTG
jgi:hypothetical protein